MIEGDQKVLEFAYPILINAKDIKDAIGIWGGVAGQAPAINQTKHSNFFALMQRFSLNAAVLGVSKIYESTNSRNKKHTAHDLIRYLENNIKSAELWGYEDATINDLGIPKDLLLCTSRKNSSDEQRLSALNQIIMHLRSSMPSVTSDKALERITDFRDKKAVHQDRLSEVTIEWLSALPPSEDFVRLAVWAEHLSALIVSFFCNSALSPHAIPCARMSTLNVLAHVLNKDFDDLEIEGNWQEYKNFYGMLA